MKLNQLDKAFPPQNIFAGRQQENAIVTLFFPDREPERSRVASILGAFAAGRPDFSWEIVDPGQQPRRALAAGAREPGTVVLSRDERRESFVAPLDAQGAYGFTETDLARALLALSREHKARVCIVQGPGLRSVDEAAGLATLKRLIDLDDYEAFAWNYLDAPGRGCRRTRISSCCRDPTAACPRALWPSAGATSTPGAPFCSCSIPRRSRMDSGWRRLIWTRSLG